MAKRKLKVHAGTELRGRLTPSAQAVKDILDKAPVDEVYDVKILCIETGYAQKTLQQTMHTIGSEYRYKDGSTYLYGNPKTIKLKKEGAYDG